MKFNPIIFTAAITGFMFSCGMQTDSNNHNEDISAFDQQSSLLSEFDQPTFASSKGDLKEIAVRDSRFGNAAAIYIKIPHQYELEGGLYWESKSNLLSPNAEIRLFDRAGNKTLQTHPSQYFNDMRGPTADYMNQLAAQYGQPNQSQRQLSPEQAMKQLILPGLKHKYGEIRIGEIKQIPDLERQLWPDQIKPNRQTTGVMVQVFYSDQAIEKTEEVYALYDSRTIRQQVMGGVDVITTWGLNRVFGISAPIQSFGNARSELLAIASSFRNDPNWERAAEQFMQQQIQNQQAQSQQALQNQHAQHQQRMQQNQAAFDASQQAYRSQQQVFDQQNASWQTNQNIQDQSHSRYIDQIRDEQNYVNPNSGETYKLSNQYNHQWSNGTEAIGTNDAFFNPNQYSNQQYYELEPEK